MDSPGPRRGHLSVATAIDRAGATRALCGARQVSGSEAHPHTVSGDRGREGQGPRLPADEGGPAGRAAAQEGDWVGEGGRRHHVAEGHLQARTLSAAEDDDVPGAGQGGQGRRVEPAARRDAQEGSEDPGPGRVAGAAGRGGGRCPGDGPSDLRPGATGPRRDAGASGRSGVADRGHRSGGGGRRDVVHRRHVLGRPAHLPRRGGRRPGSTIGVVAGPRAHRQGATDSGRHHTAGARQLPRGLRRHERRDHARVDQPERQRLPRCDGAPRGGQHAAQPDQRHPGRRPAGAGGPAHGQRAGRRDVVLLRRLRPRRRAQLRRRVDGHRPDPDRG